MGKGGEEGVCDKDDTVNGYNKTLYFFTMADPMHAS